MLGWKFALAEDVKGDSAATTNLPALDVRVGDLNTGMASRKATRQGDRYMFRDQLVVLGAIAASCIDAGCGDHATINDVHDSDRIEAQPEETTDAQVKADGAATDVLPDTESEFDSLPGPDITDRVVDNCVILDGDRCEDDCQPLYSSNLAQTHCAVAGVFFGCIPGVYSGFWPSGDVTETGEYARCDYLKDDPKQHLYCFEATYGLYWFYNHMDLFCDGTCIASPDAAPCPE